ncbi:MAG: hypothetical protein P4L85_27935 [Paludisphaera borealis]|uniref:hypothetical protein n=1 Tax=Paludisphaera borealis TaxID=1387353 RepID=UPI00284C6760|nr:hypothetical protein [Paludisphaera borealis]MDR3623216.1 hypothetical protein [Paludisphaera borealis]
MPSTPRRDATIADAMVLTAGTAVAFTCWRSIIWMPVWSGLPNSPQWYYFQALGMVAFLAPLSLTLLVIALRPPRPRLGRVASTPAGVVGFSVLFVLAVDTALLVTVMGLVGFSLATFTDGKVLYFCRLLAEQTGMAIGSAWFIRVTCGRCHKPTGWVDYTGLVLGACWILLAVASIVFTLL